MDQDKLAAEERRKKIRNLEFSLFGGENNNNSTVGLPSIRSVDEYHARYANISKEKHSQNDNSRIPSNNSQIFYQGPQKKIRETTLQSLLLDDSSDSLSTDRSLLQSSSSSAVSSDISPSPAVRKLSSINQLTRPKTSTQRLDDILNEDLATFGAGDSRLSTPSSSDEPRPSLRKPSYSTNPYVNERKDKSVAFDTPLQVNEYSESGGKATLLDNVKEKGQADKLRPLQSSRKNKSKIDEILNQEQDDLSLSMSHIKFLQLKNANLERVKAHDQAGETVPDDNELKQLEKMKHKINLTNTETIDDSSPGDTFKDIPEDVFEKIPRAVTARLENRQRKKGKQKLKEDGDMKKSDKIEYEPSTPSAPMEEQAVSPGGHGQLVTRDQSHDTVAGDGQQVGFIAMLFSGAPVVNTRQGARDQVEQDFMFALFLQKQEDEVNTSGNRTRQRPRDPDVGHFCAPNTPGFCEANFCIFHCKE